jgi:hypothetical protein
VGAKVAEIGGGKMECVDYKKLAKELIEKIPPRMTDDQLIKRIKEILDDVLLYWVPELRNRRSK